MIIDKRNAPALSKGFRRIQLKRGQTFNTQVSKFHLIARQFPLPYTHKTIDDKFVTVIYADAKISIIPDQPLTE
jgi:hypothetical protein